MFLRTRLLLTERMDKQVFLSDLRAESFLPALKPYRGRKLEDANLVGWA